MTQSFGQYVPPNPKSAMQFGTTTMCIIGILYSILFLSLTSVSELYYVIALVVMSWTLLAGFIGLYFSEKIVFYQVDELGAFFLGLFPPHTFLAAGVTNLAIRFKLAK